MDKGSQVQSAIEIEQALEQRPATQIDQVRFGLYLGEPIGLGDALEFGTEAEKWGFDVVSVPENLFWWQPSYPPTWDNFITLTTLANRTDKIRLMTTVVGPIKRHPVMIAHMAATLDHVSSGRFMLGMGAGEVANFAPLVDLVGSPPYRLLTRTKEFMTVLYGAWASTEEKPFRFKGQYFHVENAYLSLKAITKPHPPVYLAAMGPKMRQLAGKMANGWIPITYTPETYKEDWQEIKAQAISVGRDPSKIDRGLLIYTVVLEDGQAAKEHASHFGRALLSERPNLLRTLGHSELADDLQSVAYMSNLSEGDEVSLQIPRELVERVTICGTPTEVIEQIEEFIQAGVRLFLIWPLYENRKIFEETIKHYQKRILPHFAKVLSPIIE